MKRATGIGSRAALFAALGLLASQPALSQPHSAESCHKFRVIEYRSAPALGVEPRKALSAPYFDKCLADSDLQEFLGRVEAHYDGTSLSGTTASIPAQDLGSGILVVLVHEASAAPSPPPPPGVAMLPAPAPQWGPAAAGATLWSISQRLKPNYPETTIFQRVVAIREANPPAFIGDTYLLRCGALLRLPASSAVQQLSPQQAEAQFVTR